MASNFMVLLIANGVLTVAGFLFLAEAVLALLFQYFCALRGISGEGHKVVAWTRHGVVAFISVLGVIGAVLQITSANARNVTQFATARKIRQASGGMFCAVGLHAMVSPVVISVLRWRPGNPNIRKPLPTLVFTVAGACLLVESIYRVWSASVTSGWITTEKAVDTLLVLPEYLALILLLLFDFDNFEKPVVCNPFVKIEVRYDDEAGDGDNGMKQPRPTKERV